MTDHPLYQPLGQFRTPVRGSRLGLPILAAVALIGAGALGWRASASPGRPDGVVALIKPVEPRPPAPVAPPPAPTPAERTDAVVFKPPGMSTGVFLKVPQAEDEPASSTSDPKLPRVTSFRWK